MAAEPNISPTPPDLSIGFLDQAPSPMAMVQGASHILKYVNVAFCELLGKPQAELVGQPISGFFAADNHCIDLIDSVLRTGQPVRPLESQPTHAACSWRYAMWPLVPGKPQEGILIEVSESMKAQAELIDAEAQLADRALHLERLVASRTRDLSTAHQQLVEEAEARKRLEAEIARSIENERERLGQDLHDGLVQELTGITMMLHVLARSLEKLVPKLGGEADRLCRMLERAHGKARDLAKSFYPIELEQHGLLVALEGIATRAQQQYGVCCTVERGENVSSSTKDSASVQLFRIAQEAVQNAVKHACAKMIRIQLSKQDGRWHLTVRDDGIGLPDDETKSHGMGLRIMKYRAGIIQGTLTVSNYPGGGVRMSCTAPADGGMTRPQPLRPNPTHPRIAIPNPTQKHHETHHRSAG